MDAHEFRRLALSFPEATEEEHQGHPDFRVRHKIFATLGGGEEWAMIKLPAELQQRLTETHPEVLEAFPGAWGRQGSTKVLLAKAPEPLVRAALTAAWRERGENPF